MYIRRSYSYRIHRVFSSLYQPAYSSHSTYQVGSVALAARTMLLDSLQIVTECITDCYKNPVNLL